MINMTSKAHTGNPNHSEYMDEAQRAHFRQVLSNWKQQIMDENVGLSRTATSLSGQDREIIADPLDQAARIVDLQIELRTLDRLHKLIDKIDSSIDLIDHDEYGYCDACSNKIGTLRLQARPTATMCIDCKSRQELKERQFYGKRLSQTEQHFTAETVS
ncbi:MAG: DnaK suppressor protein [Dinoroseobacter sp.]|jgi:DnaK suppressor protein